MTHYVFARNDCLLFPPIGLYFISKFGSNDTGNYTVHCSNIAGSASNTFSLYSNVMPSIYNISSIEPYYNPRTSFSLSFLVSGTPVPQVACNICKNPSCNQLTKSTTLQLTNSISGTYQYSSNSVTSIDA